MAVRHRILKITAEASQSQVSELSLDHSDDFWALSVSCGSVPSQRASSPISVGSCFFGGLVDTLSHLIVRDLIHRRGSLKTCANLVGIRNTNAASTAKPPKLEPIPIPAFVPVESSLVLDETLVSVLDVEVFVGAFTDMGEVVVDISST